LALAAWAPASASANGAVDRMSVTPVGTQGNDHSSSPSMAAEGRYVAFASSASNLVLLDTNASPDVFVRDRRTGDIERVSVTNSGAQGNTYSLDPSISADGRYVAFASGASNLGGGDNNHVADIFVRDRESGTTERISMATDGTHGNGESYSPSISADGRYVAFGSGATNLVSGDTNNASDVFLRDRQTGTTTRVSLASNGSEGTNGSYGPAISADGTHVAFYADAPNLVTGDTNNASDVFVRDLTNSTTDRVSVAGNGSEGTGGSSSPAISGDGRYVAFSSTAADLVTGDDNGFADVFVRDRQSSTTERVSVADDEAQADDASGEPAISGDGHLVTFSSIATNLVPADTNNASDVFVRDLGASATTRLSEATNGTQGTDGSFTTSMSDDGAYVAFESDATELVSGDTNSRRDVFVHSPSPQRQIAVNKSGGGGGLVTSAPTGISCGASCSAFYDDGTQIVLTADPNPGSTFAGWSGGGCSGTGTCTVTLDADKNVTATFDGAEQRTLQVTKTGPGKGSITSAPAGVACGATCSAQFDDAEQVVLTATPSQGSTFAGWSGAGCSGTDPCTVTMNADKDVTAAFDAEAAPLRVLNIDKDGSGDGTVTSAPAGIDCGSTCAGLFDDGQTVTLTAAPDVGSVFAGWAGVDCPGTGSCIIEMTSDTPITATFDPAPTAPSVIITKHPKPKTRKRKATFGFQADKLVTGYQCQIDAKPVASCSAPMIYKRLKRGKHTFGVSGVNDVGAGPVSSFRWKIAK
jgi:Tol biopolymer transport system component